MATISFNDVVITRVLVSAADAVSLNGNTFNIQLPLPVQGAFHLELLNTTVPGLLLQIDGWGESITSAGRLYWRYMDVISNQRYIEWQNQRMSYKEPHTLRNLTFSLWKSDSTPQNVPDALAFELAVYCTAKN